MQKEKSAVLSHWRMKSIPSVTVEKWKEVSEEARSSLLPLYIPALFFKQSKSWSPQRLATQWRDKQISAVVDLPKHGVPYKEKANDYVRSMPMSDFIALLNSERICYLNQSPLNQYPELLEDFDLKSLALDRIFAINLWVGSKTRSGLHFDNADNLFAQVYGKKRALLVSPAYSRFLYPFTDNPSKSQVDLDDPDFKAHPNCKRIEVWSCELNPGDGLYMPRGWWHHICSEDISISVNFWHGDSLSELQYMRLISAGGIKVLGRAVYDFFWHGLLKRPYQYRLFSPPPPGLQAYEKLKLHR
ncbi:MAG TPA: cupin-like domain-containing protein [Chitinophagaceae bacterium]|nr:cupin-like domain-containing protein [Chitinophagaceae bacterium]